MKKLKPCRCCGKTAGLYSIDVGRKLEYLVSCNNEDCEEFLLAKDGEFATPEEAIKAWNEREDV